MIAIERLNQPQKAKLVLKKSRHEKKSTEGVKSYYY